MKHSWIVTAWVSPELEATLLESDLCSVDENPGFLKPIGITSERAYRPWVIKPTLEVWQEICRKINDETDGRAEGRSSQLILSNDKSSALYRYNFTIRFYRPGTLCIEVQMHDDLGSTVTEFFWNRDFDHHPSAALVVRSILGMLTSGEPRNYPSVSSFSARPAMLYAAPTNQEGFSTWKDNNKSSLVGLLINNKNYQHASDDLTIKILENNKELDVKYAKSAMSIVSKQGVLTAYPQDGVDLFRDIEREHRRRFRFLEYALVLQKFTEKYQYIRSYNKEQAEFLLFLCHPFLRSDVNLPKTVTGSNTWKLLSSEFSLERSLETLESIHLKESQDQEKYYTKLAPEVYGSIDYMHHVAKITKPHRSWIRRDFSDKKLLAFGLTTLIAVAAAASRFFS